MSDELTNELAAGRLEAVPDRARAFFSGPRLAAGPMLAERTLDGRRGPPDAEDARRLAARMLRTTSGQVGAAAMSLEYAQALADQMVDRAQSALRRLENERSTSALDVHDLVALEAVIHVRGRPALRVQSARIEPIDPIRHPDSGLWKTYLADVSAKLFAACQATGAIRWRKTDHAVDDLRLQGTAWLVAPDRAVTNRHVVFPPDAASWVRRKASEPTRGSVKSDVVAHLDFARDDGKARELLYEIVSVLYVAPDEDDVDIAVLEVRPRNPALLAGKPLALATTPQRHVAVIGHPAPLPELSHEERLVFGSFDERKRVSFGLVTATDGNGEIYHDASSAGGFSGGGVVDLIDVHVQGLHYRGAVAQTNRAFSTKRLRNHAVSAFL
ncbi:MAG TPA: trypsin-like peptidase domain-containing protein [Vicinamibacterales bacterium]|nr:trypsin-like peptidase domain-containing protein [Vicinamibacterales bacterium]